MDNLFAAHAATSMQQLFGGALKPPRKRTKPTIPMKADIDTSRPRHLPTLRAGYRYTQRIENPPFIFLIFFTNRPSSLSRLAATNNALGRTYPRGPNPHSE
jgi:hypothetical protein